MAAGGVAAGGVPRLVSANDKLNVAIVGYGGQGASDAGAFVNENVIALCDADEKVGAGSTPCTPMPPTTRISGRCLTRRRPSMP